MLSATAESGAGGAAGAPCTEITAGELTLDAVSTNFASYQYALSPELGAADTDVLAVDFYTGGSYNGQLTGNFTLGTGIDQNFATCARCVGDSQRDASSGRW